MISEDVNTLRKFLLRHIDASEKVELHLCAKDADALITRLDTIMMRIEDMEKQIVPAQLTQPEIREGDTKIVILDSFRQRRAAGGGV